MLHVIRSETKPSGQYVYFPIMKDGLHISVHPCGNPHLKNKFGQIAEIDLEMLKETTVEDFKTVFKYPGRGDFMVLRIPASLNSWFGDAWDIPGILNKVFQDRVIYVMRALRLPEFFRAKPGNYIIMDLDDNSRIIVQFQGSDLAPLNFDAKKGPANPRMKNIFSLNLALIRAMERIPDTAFDNLRPDEFAISQMGAVIETILREIRIIRWKKGGTERQIGTLLPPKFGETAPTPS